MGLFSKKEVIVELTDTEALISFTKKMKGDKKLVIKVPQNYRAYVYIEGHPINLDTGVYDNLYKELGKDFLQEIQIAYAKKSITPSIKWGFGNILVNNERLKEAYRVGMNGQLTFEVVEPKELIKKMGTAKPITSEALRDEVLMTIKTIGVPILSGFFAETNCSVFEINSKIEELRERMTKGLKEENVFKNYGIKVLSVTMNPVFINDDDSEIIRDRINN